LRSCTHFGRYRGLRVHCPCLALPESFWTILGAPGLVFMFSAPEVVLGGTEGADSCLHVFRSRSHFWRYRGRQVQFSCFVLPDSFSAVSRAPRPVFMFCAPEPIFDGTMGVRSIFHVLRFRTHFRQYRRRRVQSSCFALPDMF
jgi:hypothetical protein